MQWAQSWAMALAVHLNQPEEEQPKQQQQQCRLWQHRKTGRRNVSSRRSTSFKLKVCFVWSKYKSKCTRGGTSTWSFLKRPCKAADSKNEAARREQCLTARMCHWEWPPPPLLQEQYCPSLRTAVLLSTVRGNSSQQCVHININRLVCSDVLAYKHWWMLSHFAQSWFMPCQMCQFHTVRALCPLPPPPPFQFSNCLAERPCVVCTIPRPYH